MPEASVLIVGLVRNGERTLSASIAALGRAFASARELAFLVVESDSSDRTADRLRSLAVRVPCFRYLALGDLASCYRKRVERIAYCRNICVEELGSNPLYAGIDYVVLADLDGVNRWVTSRAVETCWGEGREWDVCCANQMGPYYDLWALRHPLWCPGDCWQECRFLRAHGVDRFSAVCCSVISRMIAIPPTADWIRVNSAFGGCAIYRREALAGVRYVGLTGEGREVCEHVSVHQQIVARGGAIYINPAFVNARVVRHSRLATPLGIVLFWFRCQLWNAGLWRSSPQTLSASGD